MACPARVLMCADRIDSRASLSASAERVQQPGAVAGPHLDHGRGLARIPDQLDVAARGRACGRVVARASRRRTRLEHCAVAGLQPFELLDQEGRVGEVGRHLLVHPPGVHRDALDGVQHGRADLDRRARPAARPSR